jgi:hypothetical protein
MTEPTGRLQRRVEGPCPTRSRLRNQVDPIANARVGSWLSKPSTIVFPTNMKVRVRDGYLVYCGSRFLTQGIELPPRLHIA